MNSLLRLIVCFWVLAILTLASPAYAGTTLANISQILNIFTIRNNDAKAKIDEQFYEANKSTQQFLSKEDLRVMKDKADRVKEENEKTIIENGAMVYIGCQIIN